MPYDRKMEYLIKNRVIYIQYPQNDEPSEIYDWGYYYENGTHECYTLFNSKAKITTYKSLKWHLLVLWYLNPKLTQNKFIELSKFISNKKNGFVSFEVSDNILDQIIYDVSLADLEYPPNNKSRKIIFKDMCGLSISEKLSIVGKLIGKSKKITKEDIYDTMLHIHDSNKKITISEISKTLNVSTRTIYRVIDDTLKREKELLNNEL